MGMKFAIFAKISHQKQKMDTKTFTNRIAQRMGCNYAEAEKLVDSFAKIVSEQCAECNRVALPGFGSFEGVKHDEEITCDLATGKRMLLPPAVEVRFVAGSRLKKSVKEGRV